MARILVDPGMTLQCDIDDYLWPWEKADPVVIVHGSGRNANFWRPWIPYLAAEHRVYRPELRGFGRSDIPPKDYAFTTESIVDDLRKVLDQCEIESAHFVGESSGSIHSLQFAVAEPKRVKSLVICDMPMKVPPEMRAKYSLGEKDQVAAILKYGFGEWCRQTLYGRLDVENAPIEMQDWYVSELAKVPDHVIAALQRTHKSDEAEFAEMLKRVQAPVLLMCGDKSALAAEQQKALASVIPDARLKMFPGFGHSVYMLAPQACAKAAIEFWDGLPK